jgi:two-component system response regulator PilR (NtrC family)
MQRMAGSSAAMQQLRQMIARIATSMAPVLVQGESGCGKELVARAIHESSNRQGRPFVAVNCAAIPENLLEAEFFGWRKGAFTGAQDDRAGFFQAADHGTLFLDEIGDLPLSMQSKLLRVIQERMVRPLGGVNEQAISVRLISATHKDLAAEVQAGRFRQDLYYRLHVIPLHVPALRERLDDLDEVVQTLLARIAVDSDLPQPLHISTTALERLKQHHFPGNVRELENLLHRAVALCQGHTIQTEDLNLPTRPTPAEPPRLLPLPSSQEQPHSLPQAPATAHSTYALLPQDLLNYLDEVERNILLKALELHRNNRTAAAAHLGLTLRQMRYRLSRLNILPGSGSAGLTGLQEPDEDSPPTTLQPH